MLPRISVLLPTYNPGDSIPKSVSSVLRQTFRDFELLIIDDGSQMSAREKIATLAAVDSRIRILRNGKNLGIQKSLNRGIREARGMFIARIDDDDEWIDPKKLEKQVDFLETRPDYGLIGTGVVFVDEQGNEIGKKILLETDESIRTHLLGRNCFFHSSVLFRKDTALQYGGYSETNDTLHVEDYDLWLKIGLSHKLGNLPIIAVTHMLRTQSISEKHIRVQLKNNLRLWQKYRASYPSAFSALLRHIFRLLVYGYLRIPVRLRWKHALLSE